MTEQDAIMNYMRRNDLMSFAPTAALIDMDGTLYDSMGHHADAWHHMMSEIGIDCDRDEFFMYEGRTGVDTPISCFAVPTDTMPRQSRQRSFISARQCFSARCRPLNRCPEHKGW